MQYPSNMALRGPFDFIGNWIQGSDWFPIEINVPDTFGAVGNAFGYVAQGVGNVAQGVGSFAQGVGTNVNNFAQGVGQGWQTLSQNFGNGVQGFAQLFPRPNAQSGQKNPQLGQSVNVGGQQKFLILVPMGASNGNGQSRLPFPMFNMKNNMPTIDNDILLEAFP